MHYAIFSDIQGNYPALEEFFNQVKGRVDRYLCLGDIVQSGTSFDDNRCLDLVQERQCDVVRGNHEDRVLNNHEASSKKISPDNMVYLATLPSTKIIDEKYQLIHAPSNRRILKQEDAEEEFQKLSKIVNICFFGHSHQPSIYSLDTKGKMKQENLTQKIIQLKQDSHYMINPGGVGLHWGHEQTYMIFDEKGLNIEFRHL